MKTLSRSDQQAPLALNLAGMAKGLYLVQIKTESQVLIKRVVIE